MPTPVFVLGKGRSGTTWLTNMLASHPSIAGVFDTNSEGMITEIKESRYFTDFYGRYGDLSDAPNFYEFVEVLASTDYFRHMGITRGFLYSTPERTYEGVFRHAMDELARRGGAQYWIEKTPGHTRVLPELARYYPDAKFVAVIRDVEPVVASTITYHEIYPLPHTIYWPRLRILQTLFSVLEWVYYNKILKAFSRRSDRMLIIKYDELVNDLHATMQTILDFIGPEYDPHITEVNYSNNTAFRGNGQRKAVLSGFDRKVINGTAFCLRFIPSWMVKGADRALFKIKGRRMLSQSHFRLVTREINNRKESASYRTGSDSAVARY